MTEEQIDRIAVICEIEFQGFDIPISTARDCRQMVRDSAAHGITITVSNACRIWEQYSERQEDHWLTYTKGDIIKAMADVFGVDD